MKFMEEKILKEGRVLPGNILKVDSFLNHRVDPVFTEKMADAFYDHFRDKQITMVMTVEASGIPVSFAAAKRFGVPLLIAKKSQSKNLGNDVYQSSVVSYTHDKTFEVTVSRSFLSQDDHVLLLDDFLALGNAVYGMMDLCHQAGAFVEGVGICIEKGFQGGGDRLRKEGIDLCSLAVIEEMTEDGMIRFR